MSSRKKSLIKILILGNSGVGKTSLLAQYVSQKFSNHYKATIGADFLTKELQIDDRLVTLQIWDTAGQERFQSLGVAFYRGADCCALVYDVTNFETFQALNSWKEEFLKNSQTTKKDDFPFIVIGNKTDLDQRVVSDRDVRRWCENNPGIPHVETSAKAGSNVERAFESIVRSTLAQVKVSDDEIEFPPTVVLKEKPATEPEKCRC